MTSCSVTRTASHCPGGRNMALKVEMSTSRDKIRLAQLINRQFGRVSRAQLTQLGIASGTVAAWLADGYLYRLFPRVYGVGHRAPSVEGDLAAALLYAGPGAALSHQTAAWWLGLLDTKPTVIHVTTPRKCRSAPGIRVYSRRTRKRIVHKQLAVTTVAELLLDLAATAPLYVVRRTLANAEYRDLLNLSEVEAEIGRGSRGASKLRKAMERHQPSLALTKSRLERLLLTICEEENLPLPELNVTLGGWQVDALWREAKLAVELDGYGNHHTPAQLRRDRRKEMYLRGRELTPVRYSEEQLIERHQVARELRRATKPGRAGAA
jgi:predicted transcriptional regulator of viral defense system